MNELHTALGNIAACAFAVDARISHSWTAFGSGTSYGMEIEYGTNRARITLYPGSEAAVISSSHRITNACEYPNDNLIATSEVMPMLVEWADGQERYRGNLQTVAPSDSKNDQWDGVIYSENVYPHSELTPKQFETAVITVTEMARDSFYHVLDQIDFDIEAEEDTSGGEKEGSPDPSGSPAFQ